MNLHDLSPAPGSKRKTKRLGIGLGSGQGKTAGKGHKGQKARAGRSVSPFFEGGQMPLSRRIPKRGFSNFRHAANYQTVNVRDLDGRFEEDSVITSEELHAKRLISDLSLPVKILGEGELTRRLEVKANAFSASAKEKIEAAGGKAEVI
ncbi:MAG: 50S ribosomal protein L15 [Synergistaceae bacterium]|jgi:large subunit ribosomal protein L15|nr:50S ribosomal protein L15 [Synergistaceae bacterium]